MDKSKLWSLHELPREYNAKPNSSVKFYSCDSPKVWNTKAPRSFVDQEFTYNFNKQGYRSENDYDIDYDYGFLIAGDSFVIGEGLPVHETWPYKFTQYLRSTTEKNIPHLALGWPGASAKRITYHIMCFVNNFKADRVLAMYPSLERFSIGRPDQYGILFEDIQPGNKKFKSHYRSLNSETLLINYIQDIATAYFFCESQNIPFNWMTWDKDLMNKYFDYFPEYLTNTNIDVSLEFSGKFARDGMHPGSSWHSALTDKLIDYYMHTLEKDLK